MTATTKPLPPLTDRQVAAVNRSGADGRRWAHRIIRNREQGHHVDPVELLYARQVLAYWENLRG